MARRLHGARRRLVSGASDLEHPVLYESLGQYEEDRLRVAHCVGGSRPDASLPYTDAHPRSQRPSVAIGPGTLRLCWSQRGACAPTPLPNSTRRCDPVLSREVEAWTSPPA